MAESKWPDYAQPVARSATISGASVSDITAFGGGSGGGPPVDSGTKDYLDAKVDAVKAQNDARFAEVLSKLDVMSEKVSHLEPVSIWKMASLSAASVVAIVTIFGVMADRFDGGIAGAGLVGALQKEQSARDAQQDAKLDEIIQAVQGLASANKLEP